MAPSMASEALRLRFAPPFHQFLTALSDLPLRWRAISAHFLPYWATNCSMYRPSSSVMGSWLSVGFRFWWYRSRHCLGVRVANICEIRTQFDGPWSSIKAIKRWSSAGDHGPRRGVLFMLLVLCSNKSKKGRWSSVVSVPANQSAN
jgi:hypothetical protein